MTETNMLNKHKMTVKEELQQTSYTYDLIYLRV